MPAVCLPYPYRIALVVLGCTLTLALLVAPESSHAAAGAGGGLPYEGWLTKLRASVTGPVAFTFALIGLVGAGGVLILGGELNGFLRAIAFIVLVMAFLVGAQNMMTGLFGRGAEIAVSPTLVEGRDDGAS